MNTSDMGHAVGDKQMNQRQTDEDTGLKYTEG